MSGGGERSEWSWSWSCPAPLRDYDSIAMGHGGGGRLTSELVEHLFLPAFGRASEAAGLGDSARLELPAEVSASGGRGWRAALTTDAFVVRPLFFPGGCVGDLAVHGTVNDLAMVGARPWRLTASFILEEGLPLEWLGRIAERMGAAARAAGASIVAGDTKVVERGRGDGCYIAMSGLGWIPEGVDLDAKHARAGDAILVSGTMGDHGIAVMSAREGLGFETEVESDTAALHELMGALLRAAPGTRAARDPTRGGLAAALNEFAARSGLGMAIEEEAIPIRRDVRAACELLGLDPLLVANEGKLVAIAPEAEADRALEALRGHPLGRNAARIGRVVSDHPGMVAARTAIGGTRVVATPMGEQLPRIC